MQKLLGQLALSALLTFPAYAFEYGKKIETVENPDKPTVEIVQDTVAFRSIDEPARSAEVKPEKARVSRAAKHSRSRRHLATRVQSQPFATSSDFPDANAGSAPLAYDAGNELHSPFSSIAKIFGGANK
ncbi:MAG: hypothetical protein NVS2B5_05850 [Beijerinckiaceae bacterium]